MRDSDEAAPLDRHEEAIEALRDGDFMAADEAYDFLRGGVTETDLPDLFEAYRRQRSWDRRTDIVDLVGLVGGPEACRFLVDVARGRDHYLVRFWAMRNLIELNHQEWRPNSRRKLRSDFYASLSLYDDYLRGRASAEAVREIARGRIGGPGGHWGWLTHLKEGHASAAD